MNRFLLLGALIFCSLTNAEEMIQPRRLIDSHTAGVLPKAGYDFECRIYPNGENGTNGDGLLLGISVGITDRLNIGLSYGGDGLIGRGRYARLNPWPGALIKYRIIDETFFLPAFALGYDHQGFGGIQPDHYTGYVYKSQGLFVALSKNYLFFSTVQLGLHGSVNFSLEDIKNVRWPDGFIGLDLSINEELALAFEYDLAMNSLDPGGGYFNPLDGYLNAGIRWAFTKSFYLEFDVKDILEKKVITDENGTLRQLGWSRELKLVYYDNFNFQKN
jgi:hypothetical protein